jgi:protein-L-isoaspartate(D-aspartate) O-methyltransferase
MRDAAKDRGRSAAMGWLLIAAVACTPGGDGRGPVLAKDADYSNLRDQMVEQQIAARGVRDERVLDAMRRVRRHAFVPGIPPEKAYEDRPHPIGHRQTISQPYIVGLMTELAELPDEARVLEIGTGSGYQAAVLAQIATQVFSIEIVEPLAESAARTLAAESIDNVSVRAGDGYAGWPEEGPFDAILVTAGAPRVPPALLEQLKVGGRLVLPVDAPDSDGFFGQSVQYLEVYRRSEEGVDRERGIPVRFVPMTGEVRELPG